MSESYAILEKNEHIGANEVVEPATVTRSGRADKPNRNPDYEYELFGLPGAPPTPPRAHLLPPREEPRAPPVHLLALLAFLWSQTNSSSVGVLGSENGATNSPKIDEAALDTHTSSSHARASADGFLMFALLTVQIFTYRQRRIEVLRAAGELLSFFKDT